MALDRLAFSPGGGASAWLGWLLVGYAAVLCPLVRIAAGPGYPAMPMFGITPCPVVVFTFGLFLLGCGTVSAWLLAIPFVWSLIGGSAAFLLHVPQDRVLLLSGIAALPLVLRKNGRALAG